MKLLRLVRNSPFVRDATVLATGTSVAQAIPVLAAPIITRLFTPGEMGLLGIFGSLASIGGVVASGQYSQAILLPRSAGLALNVLALALTLVLATTLIAVAAVTGLSGEIAAILGAPELTFLLWFLPLTLFLHGTFEALSFWELRQRRYANISVAGVVNTLAAAAAQIAAGLLGLGAAGLIGGRLVGQAGSLIKLWRPARKSGVVSRGKRSVRRDRMRLAASVYADFPKYTVPRRVLSSANLTLPSLLLAVVASPAAAGFFYLANRLLQIPLSILGKTVGQAFYQRAAQRHAARLDIFPVLVGTTGALAAIAIVPTLLLVFAGPVLFELVFGAGWFTAGQYTQWMVVWMFVRLVSWPCDSLVPVFRLQRFFMFYEIAVFVTRVAALLTFAVLIDDLAGIAAYSMVGVAFNLGLMLVVQKHCRAHDRRSSTQSGGR